MAVTTFITFTKLFVNSWYCIKKLHIKFDFSHFNWSLLKEMAASDEVAAGKIFVEFVALIMRKRIYTLLKNEIKKLEKKPNYMTVPAALRELEKIEMVRMTDGKYRMDHAVTATQKAILKAYGIDANYIKKAAAELTDLLYMEDKILHILV